MKKDFAERLMASIIRTISAIIIIAVGALCGNKAMHWREWCPNNGFGSLLIITMYLVATMIIFYGIYLISPIYIGTVGHQLMEEILQKIVVCDEEYEEYEEDDEEYEDEYDDEEIFREKMMNLRRKYIW